MDFNSVGTILLLLVCLSIFTGIIIPKFKIQKTMKTTPESIINSALAGETTTMIFSSKMDYNICDHFDARYGCNENEIGVEGGCELVANKNYKIKAYPYGTSVCLNISLVGSE